MSTTPTPRTRETTITPNPFGQVLSLATDDQFRDYLRFFWDTGCRPQADRLVEASHFDGEKHNRVVYLNEEALAVVASGVTKNVSAHTFRHSFATHLLAAGYDIRTVQELLGHQDVRTNIIYTDVLNRGGRGVESPLDRL